MSHSLNLELTDPVYAALEQQAAAVGATPAHVAEQVLAREFAKPESQTYQNTIRSEPEKQAARVRFERHFGAVNLGRATGVDNESIDADLAREYADTHEASITRLISPPSQTR